MIHFNKKDDLVSIIAPGSSCHNSNLQLEKAQNLLTSLGFKWVIDDDIFSHAPLLFCANTREVRTNSLRRSLFDPRIKIIWPFRGGYGCGEIIFDCLNIKLPCAKILIGYSDISSIHLLFNQHYKLPTIHGAVLTSLISSSQKEISLIMNLLEGQEVKLSLELLSIKQLDFAIEGEIIGGNLTTFCNLIGTKLHPDAKGKILLFEDVDEKGYQIHRHLLHLKNADIFNDVKAIIFADFSNSDEYMMAAIEDFCRNYLDNIPCFKAQNVGHCSFNQPIIFGSSARITHSNITNLELTIKSPFRLY